MHSIPANVIELCQALVRIPSVNPDGDPGTTQTGEKACAEFIGEFLRASGAQVSFDEIEPGRPNVIGRFPSEPLPDGKPSPNITGIMVWPSSVSPPI